MLEREKDADKIGIAADPGRASAVATRAGGPKLSSLAFLFAALHLVCCGLPLLLLSGVSLAFLRPGWPMLSISLAVLGLVGFLWYCKRRCATCPRNEGFCQPGQSR